MNIVETKALKKIYEQAGGSIHAVNGVDITLTEGEFVAIVGSSGCGKTTLLNLIGGLDNPTSGKVIVRERDLSEMDRDELTIFRRRNIGFVFQNYNLIPVLNVYENITLPLKLDGVLQDHDFLDEIIRTLKLEEKRYSMPNTLSGGQQQRVAIARALSTKPAIILADEPTGNLDSKTGTEVIGLIKTSAAEFNQTIAVVTHNEEIAQMADRIIRIEDGQVYREG
ncbi:MAG: ABC transporter ATP-binding protein [Lachnospiraceae bacterium]